MSRQVESANHIAIDSKDRIVVVFRGVQNRETVHNAEIKLIHFSEKLRTSGKKVHILADVLSITPSDATSEARQQARTMLSNVPFDRMAICGKGSVLTLAAYIARFSGKSSHVQFFHKEAKAIKWLDSTDTYVSKQATISRVSGFALLIIGVLGLIGWQLDNPYLTSWVPTLRPINPISAIAVVIFGIAFLTYATQKINLLRWVGILSIAIGTAALLPLGIDTLLWGHKVAAFGIDGHISDAAAICFITMGIIALVTNHTQWQWRRWIEATMAGVIGLVGIINVYGQLYIQDSLYDSHPYLIMSFNLAVAFVITSITLIVMLTYSKVPNNSLWRVSRLSLLIIVVLILTQIATYASWSQATARNTNDKQAIFTNDAQSIYNGLEDRFTAYTNLLYGFQGLFKSSDVVTEGDFEEYYKATQVKEKYPGLQTLTFTSKLTTKELPAFSQKIRNDTTLHPQGNPTFAITQLSPMDEHYILTYIAGSIAPKGTDFSSNAARLATFKQAEAQRRPIASGTVSFAATQTSPAQDGFFISVPITQKANPQKIIGFVNAVFSYSRFFADTVRTTGTGTGIRMSISDKNEGKTLFTSDTTTGNKLLFHNQADIAVANRTWQISIAATNNFAAISTSLPRSIFMSGQIFSILLIVIFWILTRSRREALNLVDAVTQDLQAERNIAVASDQKSKAILSSIGDGVFVIDMMGRITIFNAVAAQISGYTEEEALGKHYSEVLRFQFEKTGKPNTGFITKALSGHISTMANHTMIIRKDGKYISVADSAAPIRDTAERVVGAIIIFRDVTKEYELEKAKSEFVSLTSHQLRTPLSAINWYSEMLTNGDGGKLSEIQSAYVKEIFEGSNRMNDLVNALLDASRLEIDKLTSQPEPTELSKLIAILSRELEVPINRKQQTLQTHIHKLPPVDADPRQLRLILQNLMSNAVKYTPNGGKIVATLRPATTEDLKHAGLAGRQTPHWYFSINDTGYGIPKDDQPKIFDKLFRAENARALNVEGTGLGLFIVKQVVEKMGGHAWFESIETVGTTFYVVAPMEAKNGKK